MVICTRNSLCIFKISRHLSTWIFSFLRSRKIRSLSQRSFCRLWAWLLLLDLTLQFLGPQSVGLGYFQILFKLWGFLNLVPSFVLPEAVIGTRCSFSFSSNGTLSTLFLFLFSWIENFAPIFIVILLIFSECCFLIGLLLSLRIFHFKAFRKKLQILVFHRNRVC